jgi:hypothetical protein
MVLDQRNVHIFKDLFRKQLVGVRALGEVLCMDFMRMLCILIYAKPFAVLDLQIHLSENDLVGWNLDIIVDLMEEYTASNSVTAAFHLRFRQYTL